MAQIYPFKDSISQFFSIGFAASRQFFQNNKGYLAVALGIITCTFILWKSRVDPLIGRVTALEREVKSFWGKTAALIIHHPQLMTRHRFKQQIQSNLKELQERVKQLPSEGISNELEKRICSVYESALLEPEFPQKSSKTESAASQIEDELQTMPWDERIKAYEDYVEIYLKNPVKDEKLLEDLNVHKKTLLLQLGEVYKHAANDDILECLIRIHGIGRRLFGLQIIKDIQYTPSSKGFGGLARISNNSCYLATALQLFRAVGTLKSCFDPAKNTLQDRTSIEIQKSINSMLTRMDDGKTIPGQEGKALQELLNTAKIIDRGATGMYDAGEVALSILSLMGFELAPGLQTIKRIDSNNKLLNEVSEDYQLAIVVPTNSSVNVGEEIKKLTVKREEDVVEKIGKIKHSSKVSSLPEFLTVEFLSLSPKLTNVTEFDDPLDEHYKYELVFGMENTGVHWIAHVLCENNEWMTANDDKITSMDEGSLSKINRGYYVKKAKNPQQGSIVIN